MYLVCNTYLNVIVNFSADVMHFPQFDCLTKKGWIVCKI